MTLNSPRALIADDRPDVTEALRLLLKPDGYQIEAVHSPPAVLDTLAARDFDLVLMDLNYATDTTSGAEGLDLLERIGKIHCSLPVVVMTAWGSIPLAVEAMRRGARDFVEKPWDNCQLLSTLRRQIGPHGHARRAEAQDVVDAQQALLPRTMPKTPGCDIALAWRPAGDVSGDYADLIPLGQDRLGVAVGDVAGKGMPAALLMSNLQAAMRSLAPDRAAPGDLITRVNRIVSANVTSNRFITLFYGVVEGRRLVYTNAGQQAPILVRTNGECEQLYSDGPVLGVFPDWMYTQVEVELRVGDRLVAFTDGIVEAENRGGADFSTERLMKTLVSCRRLGAGQLRQKVIDAVADFTEGPMQDDATLLVLAVE
jgi:sigma-B regulation protein RsbU (phosphoserine phosphatase)